MEISDDLKIQINQYIGGDLAGKELLDFEATLADNPSLQEQVNFYKTIDDTLNATLSYQKEDEEMAPLLDSLADEFIIGNTSTEANSIHEKEIIKPSKISDKKPMIRWLIPVTGLAAAALVLLMLFPAGEQNSGILADNYYALYELSFAVRGETNDLSKAGKLYHNQNWEAALSIFNQHPENLKAQIAKGNCEYQLKQYDKALLTFQKVADGNSAYAASAAWYTALCFLQTDRTTEAQTYLKKVTDQSKYHQQAKELLSKL